jgi:hypothetical protein
MSMVTRDVPSYSIVAGNPARVLRYRFDDSIVEALLDLKWWRFAIYDLLPLGINEMPGAISRIEAAASEGRIQPFEPQLVYPGKER